MAREGGVRVPAAIRFPEKLIVEKYGSPFTVSDVLPTLFEAIGEKGRIPLSLQGKSQWKGLNGGLSEKPDYVVADLIDGFSIYHWPWKLINNEQVELYQIMKDPLEQRNLASTHPNIVTDLRQRLANWQYQPDSGIPWSDVFFDPDTFGGEENRAPWVETIKD
jgi:arylsulfatase A-like enzyme